MQVRQFLILIFSGLVTMAFGQPERWQQRIYYQMDIDFDVQTHRYEGAQRVVYQNNSPDVLDKVFYHLYFNAFQPNSMMDMRSRTIADPDSRVRDRIFNLKDDEIGYQEIQSLKQNGVPVKFEVVGTILEVILNEPIQPGASTVLDMVFEAQVPLQIRRTGRDNDEGIAYSMAQWYPKMCEYDYQGWHANPYIAREFYGVWGDFDVSISIDQSYTVAASGYLQAPETIGHGYAPAASPKPDAAGKLTWRFFAPEVHDFLWAADPDYTHTSLERKDGSVLHFFYQENERTKENWEMLPKIMDAAFDYINANFGQYPYKQYSFIQGGDGGMEYPMATLITGERNLGSLVGVAVHELMHSWYQMILGSNESLYAWMDEGFTSYASNRVMNHLREQGLLPGQVSENPQRGSYAGYIRFSQSGLEEPLTVHSDHYMTNAAYGVGAYSKGAVFMAQLEYVVGKAAFDKALLAYFNTWKFKHPNSNDVIRVFEKVSGLELDWYREYFVFTTATIDYGIQGVETSDKGTVVRLERVGRMPMPVDVVVTTRDGKKHIYNMPLQMMRGHKPQEVSDAIYTVAADWPWTHPTYELVLEEALDQIESVEIDPTQRMADINRENNSYKKN
ncbi:MAG: M1 family metallopeptidase [Saprospiraceae bacterium]|nr:M1 family metallopeptidase [Saprospiraceae bacterium]MDP4999093.1 M1 family metallopeptidase [Saprospiraceae bacterium]